MILDELITILGFKTEGERDLKRFQEGMERAEKGATAFAANLTKVGATVATAAAGLAYGLQRFVAPVAEQFDNLLKESQRLSVDFSELQELGFAAEQTGGSMEGMISSVRSLDMRLAEAARGAGRAKTALEGYGLSATNAAGETKTGAEFMRELADVFQEISVQEQGDLARALGLDRGTIALLAEGGEAMDAYMARKRELGTIDEEAAERAAEYNDTMNELQHTWQNMRNTLALGLLPTMQTWVERGRDYLLVNREIIQQRLDQVLQVTTRGIEAVGSAALRAGSAVKWLSDRFGELTGIDAGGQMTALGVGAAAWMARRHPALAAIAAVLVAIDEIKAYQEGDESVLGDFMAELDRIEKRMLHLREVEADILGQPAADQSWFAWAASEVGKFDEALTRLIERYTGTDFSELMVPMRFGESISAPFVEWRREQWAAFEEWWDRVVEGFHDAGANAMSAFLDGLRSMAGSITAYLEGLVPEWFRDLAFQYDQRVGAASAGAAVGAMAGRPEQPDAASAGTGRQGRLGTSIDPARFGEGASAVVGLDQLRTAMENFQGHVAKIGGATAGDTVLNDNRVANDNRQFPVNIGDINVNVQEATQAPAAIGKLIRDEINRSVPSYNRTGSAGGTAEPVQTPARFLGEQQ